MMIMKNPVRMLVLLCAAAPLFVAGPAWEAAAQTDAGAAKSPPVNIDNLFTNTIVAKGKGVSITRNQLDDEVVRVRARAAAQGRTLPSDLEPQVLQGLISRQLILSQATEADRKKGKEDFEAAMKKIKTAQKLTDEEFDQKLSQQLLLSGQTRAQWDQQNIEQATIPVVLDRELKVTVTDAQAKKYYEEHPASFEEPEKVHVCHILLSTKDPADANPNPALRRDLPAEQKQAKYKQAEELLKRAKAGEDFSKLAKEYSDDPGIKVNNGEYTFSKEDPFVPEFKAAAFSLSKTNPISDIVTTVFGYHIIKLLDKIPAKVEPYSGPETKTVFRKPDGEYATIHDVLTNQAMQEKIPAFIDRLRKEADVKILDESLKSADAMVPAGAAGTNGQAAPQPVEK